MSELLTALGLVLVIEGVLYAVAPGHLKAMMELARQTPDETLRLGGVLAMAAGVAIVWVARSFLAS
ncbi:MAG: DUF2065 domain-containing protein [Hyphomicrobiales bacterium]